MPIEAKLIQNIVKAKRPKDFLNALLALRSGIRITFPDGSNVNTHIETVLNSNPAALTTGFRLQDLERIHNLVNTYNKKSKKNYPGIDDSCKAFVKVYLEQNRSNLIAELKKQFVNAKDVKDLSSLLDALSHCLRLMHLSNYDKIQNEYVNIKDARRNKNKYTKENDQFSLIGSQYHLLLDNIMTELFSQFQSSDLDDWAEKAVLMREMEIKLDKRYPNKNSSEKRWYRQFADHYFEYLISQKFVCERKVKASRYSFIEPEKDESRNFLDSPFTSPKVGNDWKYDPTSKPSKSAIKRGAEKQAEIKTPAIQSSAVLYNIERIKELRVKELEKKVKELNNKELEKKVKELNNDAKELSADRLKLIALLEAQLDRLQEPGWIEHLFSDSFLRDNKRAAILDLRNYLVAAPDAQATTLLDDWKSGEFRAPKISSKHELISVGQLLAKHSSFFKFGKTRSQRCLEQVETLASLQTLEKPELCVRLALLVWQLKQGDLSYKQFILQAKPIAGTIKDKGFTEAKQKEAQGAIAQARSESAAGNADAIHAASDNSTETLPNAIAAFVIANDQYHNDFQLRRATFEGRKEDLGTAIHELMIVGVNLLSDETSREDHQAALAKAYGLESFLRQSPVLGAA